MAGLPSQIPSAVTSVCQISIAIVQAPIQLLVTTLGSINTVVQGLQNNPVLGTIGAIVNGVLNVLGINVADVFKTLCCVFNSLVQVLGTTSTALCNAIAGLLAPLASALQSIVQALIAFLNQIGITTLLSDLLAVNVNALVSISLTVILKTQ